jgi:hypothetical protein
VTATTESIFRKSLLAPARARTWLNLLYLLLAFPLGLLYFVFLLIGGAAGIGFTLLWVGVPILLVTVAAWWIFAAFERILARSLLGVELPDAPRPWEEADGLLAKARAHFTSPSTWKDLAFVLLKLPLGLFSTTVMAVTGGTATLLIVAPLFGPWTTGHASVVGFTFWHVDSWWEAAVSVLLGLMLLEVGLVVANGLAVLWRAIVLALLDDSAPAEAPPSAVPMRTPYSVA